MVQRPPTCHHARNLAPCSRTQEEKDQLDAPTASVRRSVGQLRSLLQTTLRDRCGKSMVTFSLFTQFDFIIFFSFIVNCRGCQLHYASFHSLLHDQWYHNEQLTVDPRSIARNYPTCLQARQANRCKEPSQVSFLGIVFRPK